MMGEESRLEAASTAWTAWCRSIESAGLDALSKTITADEIDLAEGVRHLARMVRLTLFSATENHDTSNPYFWTALDPHLKMGGDNPQGLYLSAPINGTDTFRISGTCGSARWVSCILGRSPAGMQAGLPRFGNAIFLPDIVPGPRGDFEILIAPRRPDGATNWVESDEWTVSVLLRQFFGTLDDVRPMEQLQIENLSSGERKSVPLEIDDVVEQLARAAATFSILVPLMQSEMIGKASAKNRFATDIGDPTSISGGVPGGNAVTARWALEPDEALVVEVTPPTVRLLGRPGWQRLVRVVRLSERLQRIHLRERSFERRRLGHHRGGPAGPRHPQLARDRPPSRGSYRDPLATLRGQPPNPALHRRESGRGCQKVGIARGVPEQRAVERRKFCGLLTFASGSDAPATTDTRPTQEENEVKPGYSLELAVGPYTFPARSAGPSDGPLVLLLHGFPESSWEWHHQIDALASAGYRAVAPEQRGYSPAARPEPIEDYSIDRLVGDVIGMADNLGASTFHLVGHDWGAIVAWHVAAAHPQRLETLTVVSVPHPTAWAAAFADPSSDQPQRSAYMPEMKRLGSEDGMGVGFSPIRFQRQRP